MSFVDGTRITPGTERCMCDTGCTGCAGAGCATCRGTGSRQCEFPCWQRVGLTSSPCCVDCPTLPDPETA